MDRHRAHSQPGRGWDVFHVLGLPQAFQCTAPSCLCRRTDGPARRGAQDKSMVGAISRIRRRQRRLHRPADAARRAWPACDRTRRQRHVGATAHQGLPANR